MSIIPSLYVNNQLANQAEQLIKQNNGISIREGLEILLKNDLLLGKDINNFILPSNSKDVGELLKEGLNKLSNSPYSALDIEIGAQTIDVRKAYKKMALKYHPDKNPTTTPIFQAIQSAHEKLSDKVKRREEEEKAKRAAASSKPPNKSPTQPPTQQESRPQPPPRQPQQQSNGAYTYQPNNPSQQREPPQKQQEEQKEQKQKQKQQFEGRSQSNPRSSSSSFNNQNTNSKKFASDDQYYEEKYRQGGYGYQGEYRFQEAQQKAKEREEIRRKAAEAAAAAEKEEKARARHHDFREGRNREYEEASARAAQRRQKGGYEKPSHRYNNQQQYQQQNQQQYQYQYQDTDSTTSSSSNYSHTKTKSHSKSNNNQSKQQSSNPHTQKYEHKTTPTISPDSLPPPSGLNVCVIDETTVELSWSVLPNIYQELLSYGLKIQLSWRLWSGYNLNHAEEREQYTQWETSTVLISGEKVRKKNLKSKKKYEFRIRYTLPPSTTAKNGGIGGINGFKGPWCTPIKVNLAVGVNHENDHQSSQQQQHQQQQQREHNHKKSSKSTNKVNESSDSKKSKHSKKSNHNPLDDSIAEEIPSDDDLENILSQSAKMAWKERNKNDNNSNQFYQRHFSRNESPPPEEVLSDNENDTKDDDNNKNNYKNNNNEDETKRTRLKQEQKENELKWYQLLPPPDSITRRSVSGEPIRYIVSLHNQSRVGSDIIGYISNSRNVLVKKIIGNWMLAQAHWLNRSSNVSSSSSSTSTVNWGWCQKSIYSEILGKDYELFQPIVQQTTNQTKSTSQESSYIHKKHKRFPANPFNIPSNSNNNGVNQPNDTDDMDENENYDSFFYPKNEANRDKIDIWVQKYDSNTGYYYYYNSTTGESEWEAPEWIEEKDPSSGVRYVYF